MIAPSNNGQLDFQCLDVTWTFVYNLIFLLIIAWYITREIVYETGQTELHGQVSIGQQFFAEMVSNHIDVY